MVRLRVAIAFTRLERLLVMILFAGMECFAVTIGFTCLIRIVVMAVFIGLEGLALMVVFTCMEAFVVMTGFICMERLIAMSVLSGMGGLVVMARRCDRFHRYGIAHRHDLHRRYVRGRCCGIVFLHYQVHSYDSNHMHGTWIVVAIVCTGMEWLVVLRSCSPVLSCTPLRQVSLVWNGLAVTMVSTCMDRLAIAIASKMHRMGLQLQSCSCAWNSSLLRVYSLLWKGHVAIAFGGMVWFIVMVVFMCIELLIAAIVSAAIDWLAVAIVFVGTRRPPQ